MEYLHFRLVLRARRLAAVVTFILIIRVNSFARHDEFDDINSVNKKSITKKKTYAIKSRAHAKPDN